MIPSQSRPLHEVTQGDVNTRMRQLATLVEELERIMWMDAPLEPEDHSTLRLLVKQMSDIAISLDRRDETHPGLVRALPELQGDLARALAGTTLDPPNYYFAGEVAGACTYCHEPRHDRGPLYRDVERP